MSKLCGIIDFDARPTSPEDERRVRTALDSPDCLTPQTCRQTGLLMGWTGTSGRGLVESAMGSVCLWDGRIDNRTDLLAQTTLPPDVSDAELILSRYEMRGLESFGDVIGDWSLCIWDAPQRRIVLASDYAGIRPLYYHRSANRLCWSSCLTDLVRWTGVTDLDDNFVADFLVGRRSVDRTPYVGIAPVPAGKAVVLDHARSYRHDFWTLPFHKETRYRDERQYEEHLFALFQESVRARLARSGPSCCELSGGLDSSSVVCMADRIRREASDIAGDLITFSYTYENSPDERFYREVERVCQVSAHHLALRDYPAAASDRVGAIPGLWEPRFQGLAARMRDLRSNVLLTGQLGDFVMGNVHDDFSRVTESLAKGRVATAARVAYSWGKAMQVPIYPILWRSMREAYFSWSPSANPRASVGAMPSISEDSLTDRLRARTAISRSGRQSFQDARKIPPGRRWRFVGIAEILQSRVLQTPETLQQVSFTHPYAHRPLVEFMLTIPPEVVVGPGQPRRLMRRAFAGLLPPLVRDRKSKASYESTYRGSLLPMAAELLKDPDGIQAVERGYVDSRSLRSRLERFSQGLDCNDTQLRQILILEFWLRRAIGFSALGAGATPAALGVA